MTQVQFWWFFKGFDVRNNKVWSRSFKDCDLEELVQSHPTPLYFTNGKRIEDKARLIREAFAKNYAGEVEVNYAVKANYCPQVLDLIAMEGFGADVVSPNEAILAEQRGIPRHKIMFTGTSVSEHDLEILAKQGKYKIDIDSNSQLQKLGRHIDEWDIRGSNLSIRLNPNVGAGHNPDVITAGSKNESGIPIKFGIEQNKILQTFIAARELGFHPDTLHIHIGSGWLGNDVDSFRVALQNTLQVVMELGSHGFTSLNLDVGGGPGIRYKESQESFPFHAYAKLISEEVARTGVKINKLIVEPGRSLVGDSTVLLTQVNTVEEKNGILHAYTDSSMGTLIRPKLYHAYHEIINVSNPNGFPMVYSVDGNVCETGDTFTQNFPRKIPEIREGDILGILDTGAYGDVMSSSYCLRGRANIVLEYKGKLIQCSKGVEDLNQIMDRFTVETRLKK
ncbi:MAG: diaminopimelate decarboxylase [Ignavibacteriae bacterium]|nr:MAG: diaminopimelate decarboxylase [Ignavibacteriota bacterium]